MSEFPIPLEKYKNLSTKEHLKRIDEALNWILLALYPIRFKNRQLVGIDVVELMNFLQKRWETEDKK